MKSYSVGIKEEDLEALEYYADNWDLDVNKIASHCLWSVFNLLEEIPFTILRLFITLERFSNQRDGVVSISLSEERIQFIESIAVLLNRSPDWVLARSLDVGAGIIAMRIESFEVEGRASGAKVWLDEYIEDYLLFCESNEADCLELGQDGQSLWESFGS